MASLNTDQRNESRVNTEPDAASIIAGQPSAELHVDDNPPPAGDIEYPTGAKVWLAIAAMYTAIFLNGLDLTIVAVAVPSLTDHFGTVHDIGCGLMASAFIPFFGKACTIFAPKSIVLVGMTIFTLGSIICTFSYTSNMFIVGRATAGLGISGVGSGIITLITRLFPSHKRSLWLGLGNSSQTIGLCCAPLIGGALIDRFSWRACFGINIPLCPMAIAFMAYCITDPFQNADPNLPFREKLKRLDLLGTVVVIPAITCLLIGLQWGGIKYGWRDARIIAVFVMFAVLGVAFGYSQYRLGERATVPLRILKQRSILAAMWFAACCNGVLAITEAYISIYWQGVRGETPTTSGLLGVSLIIGLSVGCVVAGFGTPLIGYYTRKFSPFLAVVRHHILTGLFSTAAFMIGTSIMAPIASGLLTTINLEESKVKVVALLGFLGFAVGIGLSVPTQAVAAVLSPKEVSLGAALTGFAGGLGSALFISAAATLFQGRLTKEISQAAPGANATAVSDAGLSDIRGLIGQDRLGEVLSGYNRATVETLYMPLALAVLTVIGSGAMEWRSVKKKRD
ncbi:hypothetical protein PMZ80_008201 [Knufia obscura]|uniref:Major facilitator superfamily (MFS) profile domain-containing protein n=1 Tax=Knufia obscura TaxID=1635080 RepID=A0ABR0RI90_9EURO|nr:hypothetical protein PMZ80_008201 [Knufia obscura]